MSHLRIEPGSGLPVLPLASGIDYRPVVGERLSMNVVTLQAGAIAAVHTHDEEQVGYVASGSCTFTDGVTSWELAAGDTYLAPPDVPHGAIAGPAGCVIVDVFAPPRAAVVEAMRAAGLL